MWQTWLPEKYRAKGPHVERKRWSDFELKKGAKYAMAEDPNGLWGDAWIYEDRLIYVHKRFVAIPLDAKVIESRVSSVPVSVTQRVFALSPSAVSPNIVAKSIPVKVCSPAEVDIEIEL